MFFMMGITDGRKDLDFCQTITCKICGRFGRYQVYMTYMVLSLFFIPCFKWGRRYFVQTTCCNSVYGLDPTVGKRIERGEDVEITDDDLTMVHNGGWRNYGSGYGRGYSSGYGSDDESSAYDDGHGTTKHCTYCGYSTDEDFEYCPKCGRRL